MSMMDLLTVVNTTIAIPLDVMILYTDYKTFGTESMAMKDKNCFKSLIGNKSISDMILADSDAFSSFYGTESMPMKDKDCFKALLENKQFLDAVLTDDNAYSTFLGKGEEFECLSVLLNARYNTNTFNNLNTWLNIIQDSEAVSMILGSSDSKIILNAGMKDAVFNNVDVTTASVSFSTSAGSGGNNVSGKSFGDPITGLLGSVSITHSNTGADSEHFSTNVGINVASVPGYGGSGNKTVSYADDPIPLNNVEVKTTGSETNNSGASITTTVTIKYYKLPKEV